VKKLLAFALAFVLVVQFAGLYCYYAFRLIEIRYEMEEDLARMPLHQLEKFTFTLTDYEKAKVEDKELKVNGKMYDVAKIERQNDLIVAYVLHDESEDDLISFVEMIMKKSHNDGKSKPEQLLKLISLQYLPTMFNLTDLPLQSHIAVTLINSTYDPFEPGLHTPPPRS
jgi:hypothetical protein